MRPYSLIAAVAAAVIIAAPGVASAQQTPPPGGWNHNNNGNWQQRQGNRDDRRDDHRDRDDRRDDHRDRDDHRYNGNYNGNYNNGRYNGNYNNGGYNNGRYNGGYNNGNYGYGRGGQLGGTISSFGGFNMSLQNGPAIHLHQGTVINPTGTTLQPGMNVQVYGHPNSDGSYEADTINVVGGYNGSYNNGNSGSGFPWNILHL